MSNEHSCPNGSLNCEFSDAHELALSGKIMGVIGRFSQDEHIAPCPFCLRDTMLAVAALLHLEGGKIASAQPGKPPIDGKRASKEFTQAARQRLEAVIEADAARIAQSKNGA